MKAKSIAIGIAVWALTASANAAPDGREHEKKAEIVARSERASQTPAATERDLEAGPAPEARKPITKPRTAQKVQPLIVKPAASAHLKTPNAIAVNAHEMETLRPIARDAAPALSRYKPAGHSSLSSQIYPMAAGIGGGPLNRGKRGSNPAVIGGLAQGMGKNAVLNGTAMKRKY